MAHHVRPIIADLDRHLVLLRRILDDIANLAADRFRGDAVGLVVGELLFAATVCFVDRTFHAAGHAIGIEDHPTIDVARSAADRLDQRRFGAQEAFLVGIEDAHQPAFGNIKPLAQQIDADQHVVHAEPQVADKLDALQRLDIGMHVADLQPGLMHELGQILRHALGQRGDEGAVAGLRGLAAFVDAILHLILDRTDFDRRIDQAGRANHLFGEHAAGLRHLPVAGRRRDIGGLRAHRFPFVEAQRPIVDRGREPETIFRQRQFAAVIAA